MTPRLLSLRQVAERIGNVSVAYLRRLAADRYRDPHTRHCSPKCKNTLHRRYPNTYHVRFPVFVRDEVGHWTCAENEFDTFMAARIKRLIPEWEETSHAVSRSR